MEEQKQVFKGITQEKRFTVYQILNEFGALKHEKFIHYIHDGGLTSADSITEALQKAIDLKKSLKRVILEKATIFDTKVLNIFQNIFFFLENNFLDITAFK